MSFKIEQHRELSQVTTQQDMSLGIMKWGQNNSFPQTLKNLIEQSPTAKPAVSRTANFTGGGAFENEDMVVSPYGLTLRELVTALADDSAIFESFSIHCNFNIEGEVTSMTPLPIEDTRFNQFDELNFSSKIGYFENYGSNSEVKKTVNDTPTASKIKWMYRYNPEFARDQIVTGTDKNLSDLERLTSGIQSYNGQVLYVSNAGHSSYPIPPLQAPINYVLADVENSILMRKESSTGFIDTYILKTPLSSDDPALVALESSIEGAQGARGYGKIITLSGLDPEDVGKTVLEKIDGGSNSRGIVASLDKANALIEKKIHAAYLIPPVLAGNSENNGFSEANLSEAYFVFNAITQKGRDKIENAINRILKNSIFPVKEIKLQKLTLDSQEDQEEQDIL